MPTCPRCGSERVVKNGLIHNGKQNHKCRSCGRQFVYTDFWRAYATVTPGEQHEAVRKESGKTSRVERFNLTARQWISRLVRKSLSFSKKLENHIGAIWLFVHCYNAHLARG